LHQTLQLNTEPSKRDLKKNSLDQAAVTDQEVQWIAMLPVCMMTNLKDQKSISPLCQSNGKKRSRTSEITQSLSTTEYSKLFSIYSNSETEVQFATEARTNSLGRKQKIL